MSAWTLAIGVLFLIGHCVQIATAVNMQSSGSNSLEASPPPLGVEYDTEPTHTYSSDDRQSTDEGGGTEDATAPHEVQKAVCTVTAGEVRASAEAVTTKTLKGVCGSAEMSVAFAQLEQKLFGEMAEIKRLLMQQQQQQQPKQLLQHGSFRSSPPVADTVGTASTTTTTGAPSTAALRMSTTVSPSTPEPRKAAPQLKSLTTGSQRLLREHEVSQFNNTMLTDRDFKVFTYYWKLENFTARIESGASDIIESPIFSIKGKTLHIKAYLQHLHRDFLYLQLEYALLKSSNRHNIILDMGGLFKEIGNEKVRFKHKISVLDQNNHRSKDLISQELYNLDAGFLIPNSALLGSPYIKNDTLLIQIFLYL